MSDTIEDTIEETIEGNGEGNTEGNETETDIQPVLDLIQILSLIYVFFGIIKQQLENPDKIRYNPIAYTKISDNPNQLKFCR